MARRPGTNRKETSNENFKTEDQTYVKPVHQVAMSNLKLTHSCLKPALNNQKILRIWNKPIHVQNTYTHFYLMWCCHFRCMLIAAWYKLDYVKQTSCWRALMHMRWWLSCFAESCFSESKMWFSFFSCSYSCAHRHKLSVRHNQRPYKKNCYKESASWQ